MAAGEASTCDAFPRRSGSDASSDVWLRRATKASCSGARESACAWTSPVATTGTPSRAARLASARLRARSWRWNGRCSSTRRPSRPKAPSSRRRVGSSRRPWRAHPLRHTSPPACASRVSSGTAGGGSSFSRERACARVRMWHRFRQPSCVSTKRVRWRTSGPSRSISAPCSAFRPAAFAACANSIEPETPLWSVRAKAPYPRPAAAAASSSGSEAPSRKEKAECACSSAYMGRTHVRMHSGRIAPRPEAAKLMRNSAGRNPVVIFLEIWR